MRYANDLIPYDYPCDGTIFFTESRRAKNMANQSKMQLSLLDIEQHELLLISVAHKFMQLKMHNKRRNHRRFPFVGHTLMDLVQLVVTAGASTSRPWESDISDCKS